MARNLENGPYNLLSLDGGGIRGVSELVVLHRIMQRIQEKEDLPELPKPCDYFHLIGGTSTGGLIAIMLGRLRMSTADALVEYDSFAKKIFRKWNRRISASSQFKEDALEAAVRDVVAKCKESELMRDPTQTPWMGKAFVCTKPAKDQDRGPRRLRGYPSDDDWGKDCKIWEAARATTAAPGYFRSLAIKSGHVTEEFIDAALGCNNPAAEVLDEAGEVLDSSCKLGCVLSLGTGTRTKGINSLRGYKYSFDLLMTLKDITTDSETTHEEIKKRFTEFPSTYFRFSVPSAAAKIGMVKYKKIPELKRMTEEYLDSEAKANIERVVDILCDGTTENVTVGHVRYPSKDQIIMDTRRAQTGGTASSYFTGRTNILNKMSAVFEKRDNPCPRREFLLYGMGGVGKTQIALKFKQMMEYEKRVDRVFWIDATDVATIDESYNNIASKLFPDVNVSKPRPKVLDWMETTTQEWLLILDNCNDEDLTNFLPESDKGNIIYTSRHNDLKQTLLPEATQHVNEMEEDDAAELLLRAMREKSRTRLLYLLALDVVRELGCLPLAIDQAGAYMSTTRCSLRQYFAVFRKQKKQMLKDKRFKGSTRQNQAVYTTFDVSHKTLRSYAKSKKGSAIAAHAAMGIKILNIICFYHNQDILAEDIVQKAAENRDENDLKEIYPLGSGKFCLEDMLEVDKTGKWKPDLFRDATILLESLSLIKKDSSGLISMHVLVHSWARDRMGKEERESFSLSARILLYHSIHLGAERSLVYYRRKISPHVFTCERLVTARHHEDICEADFQSRLATIFQELGAFDKAETLWEKALYEVKMELDWKDPRVLLRMSDLANLYLEANMWMKAEALMTEIIARQAWVLPRDHAFCPPVYRALGSMYHRIGLFKEAILVFEEEKALLRLSGHPDDMERIETIDQIIADAVVLMANGVDFGSATTLAPDFVGNLNEEDLWKEYDENLQVYGPDGDKTLRCLYDLCLNFERKKQSGCAGIIANEAIIRCEKRFVGYNMQTADFLALSGDAYRSEGLLELAILRFEQNLETHIECIGHDNVYTEFGKKQLRAHKEQCQALREMRKLLEEHFRDPTRLKTWEGYEDLLCMSVCGTSSCGRSGHRDLIRRLGIEQTYPNGVNITRAEVTEMEGRIARDQIAKERTRRTNAMSRTVEANLQTIEA